MTTFSYHNYGPLEGGATTEALCEISRNFRETTAPLRGALPPLRGDGRRFLTVTTAPLEGGAAALEGGATRDGGTTTFPYHNYGPP